MSLQPHGSNWVLFVTDAEIDKEQRELMECAERVWPIARASGRRQINTETSIYEKDRLISEAWEYALLDLAKTRKRKCLKSTNDLGLDAYLMKSFQHRLGRLMKSERMYQRLFTLSEPHLLELSAPTSDDSEITLHLRLQVQEVVARMDDWTKQVWSFLVNGLSWKLIAARLGMNQAQAKMRYRYQLEKIRLSLTQERKPDGEVAEKRGRRAA